MTPKAQEDGEPRREDPVVDEDPSQDVRPDDGVTHPTAVDGSSRPRWRSILTAALIVLAGILSLLSVTTGYVRTQLLDTDGYVATVAPLASDPAVQRELTDAIVTEIDAHVDLTALSTQAVQEISEAIPGERPLAQNAVQMLAPVLVDQARARIQQTVQEFVESPKFAAAWSDANRRAHDTTVAVLTGETHRDAVVVDTTTGSIGIDLGPIVEQVKQRLLARGLGFASSIPAVDKEVVLWHSDQLRNAQRVVAALDTIATVLPWLTLLAIAGAIALAGADRRTRALALAGLAIFVAMVVLAVLGALGRVFYLDAVPPEVIAPDAARAVFDIVTAPLVSTLRAVALVGLLLAVIGYFIGDGREAIASRRDVRGPVEVVIAAIAGLVIVFWHQPTLAVLGWTVFLTLALLVTAQFMLEPVRLARLRPANLRRPAPPAP